MHTRQAKRNDYYKGAIGTYMLSNQGIAQHEYRSQEKGYSNQATKRQMIIEVQGQPWRIYKWAKSSFEKWAFNWHIQCYCTPHCEVHDGKSGIMICGHKVYTNFVTKKMIWKLENWSAF